MTDTELATEKVDPPTAVNPDVQRRQWHEEDVQRLEGTLTKTMARTQWKVSGVSLVLVALVSTGLWFMTYVTVTRARTDIAREQVHRASIDQRMEAVAKDSVSVDKYDSLNARVKEAENSILEFTRAFRALDQQLSRMDNSVGAATSLVAVVSKDLTQEAEARRQLAALQAELIAAMERFNARLGDNK